MPARISRRASVPTDPPSFPVAGSAEAILTELEKTGDSCSEQERIDQSITPALEGFPIVLHGVILRPFTLSAVMLLHSLQNEIMQGKKVREMANPIHAALQFLYVMDSRLPLLDVSRWVQMDEQEREDALLAYGETLSPSDNLVVEIIEYINDQTATRVNAKLPANLSGERSFVEKNA